MTNYELTRRDALKALGAAGVTVTGGAAALTWNGATNDPDAAEPTADDGSGPDFGDHERETYRAVAAVVYPSEVTGVSAFVDSYLAGRTEADPGRAAEMAAAVADLDAYTREWEDTDFAALDAAARADILRGMGTHTADPDPHGDPRNRVRYYLVNDLLFALYGSPTGGDLVGIENPQGYPGGTSSYQQPPSDG